MKTIRRLLLIIVWTMTLVISSIWSQSGTNLYELRKLKQEQYVPNTIIVKVKSADRSFVPGPEEGKGWLAATFHLPSPYTVRKIFSDAIDRATDLENILEIEFGRNIDIIPIIDKLMQNEDVIYATPRIRYKSDSHSMVQPENMMPSWMPNDPMFPNQWNLAKVHATEAWEISQGDPSVVIAITDTDIDWRHEDMVNQIAYNTSDPINKVDDDHNGYIDDYQGWDFGDFDNNTIKLIDPTVFHGTGVAGIAGAAVDNGKGLSGVCPLCKLLPVKMSKDDDPYLYLSSVEGIKYAVDRGAKVLNCSWGTYFPDPFTADLIAYAVAHDVVVVAAAGNSNTDLPLYPADYPGVIKVAATDQADKRVSYSNFGRSVDVCAPTDILATYPGNHYGLFDGTSAATPMVSGLAAILRSYYPSCTAEGIGEIIRRSCDPIDQFNPAFIGQLGAGRINMLAALTIKPASIRLISNTIKDINQDFIEIGDTVQMSAVFKNYFDTLRDVTITLSSSCPFITFTKNKLYLSEFSGNKTFDAKAEPFEFILLEGMPTDEEVEFGITITADGYQDYQALTPLLVNPSFTYFNINHFASKVNSEGRFGFHRKQLTLGDELRYRNKVIAGYPMALMAGSSINTISDAVLFYNSDGTIKSAEDFRPLEKIKLVENSSVADMELDCSFDNQPAHSLQSYEVKQKVLGWFDNESQDYFITEYTFINTSPRTYENFYIGLFDEVQISNQYGSRDLIDEDRDRQLGYGYDHNLTYYTGIKVLQSAPFHHCAIDANADENGINMYNGFTENEKYVSLKSDHAQAGHVLNGADVAQVVSSGPYTFVPGDSIKVAFAIVGAISYAAMMAAADCAEIKYSGLVSALQDPFHGFDQHEIYAYPNPVHKTLNIHNDNTELSSIKIFNLEGKELMSVSGNEDYLNVSGFLPGTYVIAFNTKQAILHQKFIVQ